MLCSNVLAHVILHYTRGTDDQQPHIGHMNWHTMAAQAIHNMESTGNASIAPQPVPSRAAYGRVRSRIHIQ